MSDSAPFGGDTTLDDHASTREGGRTLFYNVVGGAVGAILAAISMLGLVAVQSSTKTPQGNIEVISYDG